MWIRKHKQTQKMEQKMSKLGASSISASENFVKNNLLKMLFLLTEREKRNDFDDTGHICLV